MFGISELTLASALDEVWKIFNSTVSAIGKNPVLAVWCVFGLAGAGFKLFKKARKSVGG